MTSSLITLVFIIGLVMIVLAFIRKSVVGLVMGSFIAFIGAFYLFNLDKLAAFKYIKMVFDMVLAPFIQK